MTELLLPPPIDRDAQDTGAWLTPGQATLRQMVLDAVTSPSTRHSYGRALDDLSKAQEALREGDTLVVWKLDIG